MARMKWLCLALLPLLSVGVSFAGRVTEVDDKPEVVGSLGWQPGFLEGIIGALGHFWPQTPTPPPSPEKTGDHTNEGLGGGQIDGTSGGGDRGLDIGGGNGGIGLGRGNGFGGGGSGRIDIGGGNGISGGGIDICGGGGGGGLDIGGGGFDIGGGGGGGWGDYGIGGGWGDYRNPSGSKCKDQSCRNIPNQSGNPSIVIPSLTIPGFDVADVIGGEVSLGSSGGLYCTPINCQQGNSCRGIRLYLENWKDPKKAGSNGQEQNTNHEKVDEHDTNTLDIAPASNAPKDVRYMPIPIIPPSPLPVSVAATSETVDPQEEEQSKVPKPAPISD